MTQEQRAALLARVSAQVSPEHLKSSKGWLTRLPDILELIEQSPMTLRKLRHLIFDSKTEKTSRVCPSSDSAAAEKPKGKRKGHGRIKAKNYTGARWEFLPSACSPRYHGVTRPTFRFIEKTWIS